MKVRDFLGTHCGKLNNRDLLTLNRPKLSLIFQVYSKLPSLLTGMALSTNRLFLWLIMTTELASRMPDLEIKFEYFWICFDMIGFLKRLDFLHFVINKDLVVVF